MSSDANEIANIAGTFYMISGAPIDLAVGSFFLYQLLVRVIPLVHSCSDFDTGSRGGARLQVSQYSSPARRSIAT
jgi:hypothetical protein